jgi:hypothetical protein
MVATFGGPDGEMPDEELAAAAGADAGAGDGVVVKEEPLGLRTESDS